ncbi:mucin-12-like [Bubalus kerabau]|uniref:mucin-12-like n=1 Tax=Bubalus carabanensis TaxID=3119969 RepID=UPI00244E5C74|nr:mucin-12-like [Bubalus carabanensis]
MTILKGNIKVGGLIFLKERRTLQTAGDDSRILPSSARPGPEGMGFPDLGCGMRARMLPSTLYLVWEGADNFIWCRLPAAVPRPGAGPAPSLRGASRPMQLFRVLRLLWMLKAFLGSTGQCHNGGTWNGKECICAQGYSGYQCKFLTEYFFIETPQKINATVDLKVKVTNRNFTDDLKNKSSAAYKNFVQVFKRQMDKVYRGNNFPQYRGVNVKRLLPGSIMVEHEVIMEANYTSGYLELFENLTKIVRAKIMNETGQLHGNSEDCKNLSLLCYDETATSVDPVKVNFDPQEQCTKNAAKEFAQFYYMDELDGKLACVTKCTPGTKSEMDCHHGRCELQQSGPRCLCLNSDTHWYSGETCESSTSKSMVYGIVGAVVALLVVLVVVLIVLLSRSQRKLHSRQEYDGSREWQDAGYPGSFENTSLWEGQDLKGDTFGLENIYRNFQPSLQSVDPTTELHIQRPSVVATAR